jgi:hypothetical protein
VRRAEHGFATIQFTVAVGFSLVLLVLLANLFVDLYARAAIRGALDEGARAGAAYGGGARACGHRVREALGSVIAGPLGRDVVVRCDDSGRWSVASADVRLRSWLPALVPDWRFRFQAAALEERL